MVVCKWIGVIRKWIGIFHFYSYSIEPNPNIFLWWFLSKENGFVILTKLFVSAKLLNNHPNYGWNLRWNWIIAFFTLKNIWIETFHGFVKCKSSSLHYYIITNLTKHDQTTKIMPVWFNKNVYLQKQCFISTSVNLCR